MNRYGLFAVLFTVIAASTVIPAFAEVTSLKTNTSFYKGGSKIYFSGTILDTDPPNVTILLFDPTNKFIMLSSGAADSNHQFQIVVDTSTSDNQQKFSLKGVYNATAFIATKENGKTVNFIYSPDGSPVTSFPPTSLTSSSISSTEIDLSWVAPTNTGGTSLYGYKIERDDGTGFVQIQNTQSTTYQDTGLTPNKLYSYRISAVNQAGTSDPSNVATSVTLSPPVATTTPPPTTTTTTDQSTGLSLEDQIKQRLADAQRIQQLLHGQNPNSAGTTPGVKQTVKLSESMVLDDMAGNLGAQKSGGSFMSLPSGISNFDASALLYPVIILAGVGIVVAILYMRKKQRLTGNLVHAKTETFVPVEVTPEPQEDDHAIMILKNRLAKGEITIDEFKALKDELLEP
ncbi:MAG TPA: fibronectin type III domain-containing protein [Candidatus Nitrosotalea sp.]|nr:fibronectin type III domain-containing protein [Candidatus Nitrosotalea sp.]